jgi:hypothetical protein
MADAPLLITPSVRAKLNALRDEAARWPVDVVELLKRIDNPRDKTLHTRQMDRQTVVIPGPWVFVVTFSIEIGQPCGTCRHVSISIDRPGRVPSLEAVWMIATELGFVGDLDACAVWPEKLSGDAVAVNVVQPLSVLPFSDLGASS